MVHSISDGLGLCIAFLALSSPCALLGRTSRPEPDIAKEVRHELVTLPFYMLFDYLDFRVDGDIVTLLGQVTRAALRNDAEKAVSQIPGVSRVVDEIEILPPSKVDEKLRLAEHSAICGDPELIAYTSRAILPIYIIVKNSTVTLEGTVGSAVDKTEVFTRASSVPGVTTLTNHLKIGP